jgi:hypothetical protein
VIAVAAALVAFLLGSRDIVRETRLQATQPWENAKMVAQMADETGIDRVYTNRVLLTLQYYVGKGRLMVLCPTPESSWRYCFLPTALSSLSSTSLGR